MLGSLIVSIFFLFSSVQSQQETTLRIVQILFRHGIRSPNLLLTFPTDPPDLAKQFVYERGEMTEKGMQQVFTLGQNLRQYYGKFLKNRYRASELRVLSGVDNRTIASALIALAALFPPQQDQIWNRDLLWIPIPVQTEPIIDE
uniref:Lysosomal acid phosphatase n=1 Tax=Acrobeloides nanus TaxID=290746 RepID=A0A914C3X2_9BILA